MKAHEVQSHDLPADFSLTLGGPLYQLYLRTKLLTPPIDLLRRRVIAITMFCWLPLVILTLFAGRGGETIAIPFFADVDVNVRFLISVPLLIIAEVMVHHRIGTAVREFHHRDLIAPEDRERFQSYITSAMRWRNSLIVEVVLLLFSFTLGYWVWRNLVALKGSTWYFEVSKSGAQLSLAGYWYAFVSLSIFRFLLFRWYYRLFLWYRFLWQVSGLPLRLNAIHPDRAGGLGFLGNTGFAFAAVLLAHTCLFASLIANRIWHDGMALPAFKMEIATVMVILLLLALLPQLFFFGQMERAKRIGSRAYGTFASHYVNKFHSKWIESSAENQESLLGSSDIQSLADLGNSYQVTHEMRMLPFGRKTLIQLGILIALPFFPLLLTMVPFDEILNRCLLLVL